MTADFYTEYARHRAQEGRGYQGEALVSLPYLKKGAFADQWRVRARSYEAFIAKVVMPMAARGPLDILDLGAGNGWLCHRLAWRGHRATALDIREDDVDGLGAARQFLARAPDLFAVVAAPFEALPFASRRFDIAVFNASLHYARDLAAVLNQARRVLRSGGMLVVMDSPFYTRESDGAAMLAEQRGRGETLFGSRAGALLAPDFIEYLTPQRLAAADPALTWRRHRVRYPLGYELRPLLSKLKRRRAPSRFDLWTAAVP